MHLGACSEYLWQLRTDAQPQSAQLHLQLELGDFTWIARENANHSRPSFYELQTQDLTRHDPLELPETPNMADEHKPEAATDNGNGPGGAEPTVISLTFRDQRQQEVVFKLKPTTKLGKAMVCHRQRQQGLSFTYLTIFFCQDAYSTKYNRQRRELRFLFEGVRLLDTQTPAEVSLKESWCAELILTNVGLQMDMDDDCLVDVFEEQLGGAGDVQ